MFKAKVPIAALKGDEGLAALEEKYVLHPNQITQWNTQLLENACQDLAAGARDVFFGRRTRFSLHFTTA